MKRFLALFLAIGSLPGPAAANISAMGSGNSATGTIIATNGELQPLKEHPTAGIVSENLHITLQAGFASVDLTYILKNEGRATKVKAGFPSIAASFDIEESEEQQGAAKRPGQPRDLLDYAIELDGKRLATKLHEVGSIAPAKKADDVDEKAGVSAMTRHKQWLVSELALSVNGTHRLHISYRAPYEVFRYYVSDDGTISDATFAYQLSTGRNWRGPIHEGKVEIECAGVDAAHIKIAPDGRFKRVGQSFVWEFSDLEPTTKDDIRVVADPAHEERKGYVIYPNRWYYENVACDVAASSELREKDKVFAAANLTGGEDSGLCWAEGVKGDGIGESVTLTLKKPATIDGFNIRNGFFNADDYENTPKLYKANNRVSKLEVQVDDRPSFRVDVPDEGNVSTFIRFPGGAVMAHKVKFVIADVYKGTRYHDTCLAYLGLRQVLTKKPEPGHAR